MAVRLALHYIPRPTVVHRWDPRTKLLGVLCITSVLLFAKAPFFGAATLGFFALSTLARLPWNLTAQTVRAWAPFLAIVFLIQAPEWNALLHRSAKLAEILPADAVKAAALTLWRLMLMILWAVLFTATTKIAEVQHAVFWMLHRVPGISARRVAVMAGLSVRLFTTLLDDLEDIRRAHRARWGSLIKNPVRRIKTVILPLIHKALERAEFTALALAARGYRDDVPVHVPPWPRKEMLGVLGLVAVVLLLHGATP